MNSKRITEHPHDIAKEIDFVASDDFSSQRQLMVERQLQQRGIHDPRVLAAMRAVPRELFVPDSKVSDAYADCPLPIGEGQTISQPFTVAFMAEALHLRGDERVLEIGTGSGYGAAILAQLSAEVHTVERIPLLAEQARRRLAQLGLNHVHVHQGDGSLGWAEAAPFDAIVVTAGAASLPTAYIDQLGTNGRIVIPIGRKPTLQHLYRFWRQGEVLQKEDLGAFAFVPLIGRHGWQDR